MVHMCVRACRKLAKILVVEILLFYENRRASIKFGLILVHLNYSLKNNLNPTILYHSDVFITCFPFPFGSFSNGKHMFSELTN